MERRAENGNFEMCKGSIIKSHKLHFSKIHGGYYDCVRACPWFIYSAISRLACCTELITASRV